jgi:hypothetical protein
VIWLGEGRGYLTDFATQLWVRATGRKIAAAEFPWLSGPTGSPRGIGAQCFRDLAERDGLTIVDGPGARGILPSLQVLSSPELRVESIAPAVRGFYENTSAYELDAWSEWCGAFRPFGWLLAGLFSRRLQQLNVPLSGLDTSRGMTNEVWHLVEPGTGEVRYVAWIRHLVGSGTTIYAGSYGPCRLPGWPGTCLRVVFPLPNGNALVIMKPVLHEDGSLSLVSGGNRFGDPGFYFTVRRPNGALSARYVRTMRETIRVYSSAPSEARADHTLTLFRRVFLRIHYRLRPTSAAGAGATQALG